MKPLAVGSLALLVSVGALAQEAQLPFGHPPLDEVAGRKAPPLPPDAPKALPPGHPAIDGAAAPGPGAPQLSEQELLKQLDAAKGLKDQDKPFEVAAALGKLYYGRARYKDSAEFLDQAAKIAEPARALYLEQRKKTLAAKKAVLGAAAAGCERGPGATLASLTALAKQKAKAADAPAAAACALSAIEPLREVFLMLGNAWFIQGEAKAAIAARDRQLEAFQNDPDALFSRGAMVLDTQGDDLKALARAKADFAQLAQEDPGGLKGARGKQMLQRVEAALAAGGVTKLAAKEAEARKAAAPPPAQGAAPGELVITPQMMEAVQNTERTPELEAGFKKLLDDAEEHLARGRYQDALANCSRVVPFEPNNARAKSGMAWALVQLNKQPMADRVWKVAVEGDPGALDRLGETLKAKGDAAQAKALWTKLAQSAPAYATASKLNEKLK